MQWCALSPDKVTNFFYFTARVAARFIRISL